MRFGRSLEVGVRFLFGLMSCFLVVGLVACPSTEEVDDDDTMDEVVEPVDAVVLEVVHEPLDLTELALEALEVVPDWVADDLAIALDKVSDEDQDDLAALIVDQEDIYLIDEIAFAIAHTSPEVIEYPSFYPELFQVNAELIYAYDPELDYVQLEDVGEPGVDEDFYTTATYRIEREDGSIEEVTIDRDHYYWYLVHPRLEDEYPLFIDGWVNASGTSPDNGWFWREFLWEAAADECPADRTCHLLKDYFEGVDFVMTEAGDKAHEGAIGGVIQFVLDAIDFGAGDERPVQPVRIYTVVAGNCGEHADFTTSSARTALIPARNVGAFANDHTWNEFWTDRWVQTEPIGQSVDSWGYYGGGIGRDGEDDDCDGVADDALFTDDADGDGYSPATFDCDDNDADVYPGATELHNGYDDDCDGVADPGMSEADLDADGDGFSLNDGDCNDVDGAVYPYAVEITNGLDDDCDGTADDGLDTADADGDGFAVADGDCNDNDAAVHPDAAETGNAVDDNCDGHADEGFLDPYLDSDGDGWTIADGDCNDTVDTIYPGAPELENLIDDDCDGDAEGAGMEDHDGDGYEIIFHDCDDTNPDVFPGAPELPNGIDDNCDGQADEGLRGHDRDGDGWTIETGDCDDLDAGRNPDAQDPSLSSNRLYVMTSARGDTYLDTTVTEHYGSLHSYLDFQVNDENGQPVDGAVVLIYGTWAVYGYPDQWAWAGEVITDLDGYATTPVGEFNPYGYAVYSNIGDDPGGDYLYEGVEQSVPYETYALTSSIGAAMPDGADPAEADLTEGKPLDVTWSAAFEVESYRVDADGTYGGSMSVEHTGGRLDTFVVDAANYELFKDDQPFEAQAAELDATSGEISMDLPRDKSWALVLSNKGVVASTMVGTLAVTAAAAGDAEWTSDAEPLEMRYQIPPGEYLTVTMTD
jgi:hypothetical protein